MSTLSAESTLAKDALTTKLLLAQPAVERVESLAWSSLETSLDDQGSAVLPGILSAEECRGARRPLP